MFQSIELFPDVAGASQCECLQLLCRYIPIPAQTDEVTADRCLPVEFHWDA